MDWLGPIVEIIKCLWEPVSQQIGYIKGLNDSLDTLKSETDELKCMRDGIRSEVDHAVASGTTPPLLAKNWLKVADSWITQVDSIRSVPEGGRSLLYFAHLNARRKLGKKVLRLRDEVRRHKRKGEDLEDGKAAKRARHSLMPDKRYVPRELEEQKSSKEAVEKILQWLKEEEVGVICVWGMGGVGKTTIVKQICNRFEGTSDFQQVIWVTVSKDRDLEAIQKRIANKLELEFRANDSIEDKRDRLRCRLNNVRYLLILDDLWQTLPLEQVEIPQPNRENGCKIIITTRKNEVSNEMEADRQIKIQPLGSKEAWDLFCNKTENAITSPEIRPLAEAVLKECGGLPLAIITVGRAMRHKPKKELWQNVLRALKRAATEISGMEGEVFRLLKLSYDCLENDQIKSCFLFCALYPEDYKIDVRRLVRFWAFGEGLVNNAETLDDALNKGHVILEKLIDVCLLEKGPLGRHYVRMHDLIRDLAIWITSPSSSSSSSSGQKFLVKAGEGLEQPPEEILWEGMTKISLMNNRITEIQMMPNCPDLVSLLLSGNSKLHTIGDHFFRSMPNLQILDLSYTDIKLLPPSLSMLVNLRVLILRRCYKLKETPGLGDLKELELVDLCYTGIENLPPGVVNLSKLKLLDITGLTGPEIIPPKVISRLTCLEDLRLLYTTAKVTVDTWRAITALPRLTCLEIHLPLSDGFTTDVLNNPIWSRLKRYDLRGAVDLRGYIADSNFAKSVYIYYCQVFPGQISCVRNAEYLDMFGCHGLQRLSQIIGDSRNLNCIFLFGLVGLKCCIDWRDVGEDNAILGCLETLKFQYLDSLEKVFDGAPRMTGFGRLRYISIFYCPKLTYIFSSSMLQHLYQLEKLEVVDCEQLEEIVEGGPFPDTAQLKLTDLRLEGLPKLITICRQHLVLMSVTSIIVVDCPVLTKLPILCSNNIQEVSGWIRGRRELWEGIEWEDDYSKSLYSTIYEEVKY